MGDFGRPRPNMGDQKSPNISLDLRASAHLYCTCHNVS